MYKKLSQVVPWFLDEYSLSHSPNTIRLHKTTLSVFVKYMGEVDADTITAADIAHFMTYLRNEHEARRLPHAHNQNKRLSPAAIDNYWKSLRAFWQWYSSQLGTTNPAEKLPRMKHESPEVVPFSLADLKALNKNAAQVTDANGVNKKLASGARNLAMLFILLDTGIRLGELCRLTIADVRMDSGDIVIRPYSTGKKSRPRIIPMGKRTKTAVWKYLADLVEKEETESLFSLTPGGVRIFLDRLGKRAGVKNCHPHRFRHTFAIEYLRGGGDIYTLQRILGHASLEMCRHYLAIVDSDVKTAHNRASPADRLLSGNSR